MSDESIIKYINSFKYLRRSLKTSIHLKENPFNRTSTNQISSIVTQLKLLIEKFFGDDIIISNISDKEDIFDEELKKNIEVVYFNLLGYKKNKEYDMIIESNFAPLFNEIIKSIKLIDPKFFLNISFEYSNLIRLAISSEEPSNKLFDEDEDDEESEEDENDENEEDEINSDIQSVD